MKKRLESELISIAHRILKLKNKAEVDQLYKETQKLYETLSVLKFYQDNFESVKSDVSQGFLEEKLEHHFENETPNEVVFYVNPNEEAVVELKTSSETSVRNAKATPIISEIEESEKIEAESIHLKEIETSAGKQDLNESEQAQQTFVKEKPVANDKPAFTPIFELEVQREEEITLAEIASDIKPKEKLEDMIGKYADPIFVKPNEVSLFPPEKKEEESSSTFANEVFSKSIAIGLNDRIGFVQHLFNESNEDFNRVISQLNTFDTFEEAKNFINEMVIPDYNYWIGEEDYIERFMAIVEKKFA